VLCDANLVPQRPAILYGIDTRASAEIDDLNRRYGSEEILRCAGKSLSSQALGLKLEWVRRVTTVRELGAGLGVRPPGPRPDTTARIDRWVQA
jgi:hypothetical protein